MDATMLNAYITFIAALLGLVMGSFLTCAASRQMAGIQWVTGHSVCDFCGHELGALDLIPVLSWVCTGGKCRHCKHKLPASYPLTEILCAAGFGVIAWYYGPTLLTVELIAVFALLFAASVCDWVAYTIPNGLVIAIIAVRVAFAVTFFALGVDDGWLMGLACGFGTAAAVLVISLIFGKLRGVNAMGGGDIKLLFAVGLYLNVAQCLIMVFVACVVGIALGLIPRKGAAHSEAELDERDAQRLGLTAAADDAADGTGGASGAQEAGERQAYNACVTDVCDNEPASQNPANEPQLIPFGVGITAGFWFALTMGTDLICWYAGLL